MNPTIPITLTLVEHLEERSRQGRDTSPDLVLSLCYAWRQHEWMLEKAIERLDEANGMVAAYQNSGW